MVTILRAGYQHGYSRYDHLITGHECEDVVGRAYRSVGEAQTAAWRAAARLADRRVTHAPIWLEVRFADGSTRRTCF